MYKELQPTLLLRTLALVLLHFKVHNSIKSKILLLVLYCLSIFLLLSGCESRTFVLRKTYSRQKHVVMIRKQCYENLLNPKHELNTKTPCSRRCSLSFPLPMKMQQENNLLRCTQETEQIPSGALRFTTNT
jgi:hypothetical protein